MATFRQAREALLYSYDEGYIDDEEFLVLYDLNQSKNLDYPYWNYNRFNLENLDDAECWSHFRFHKPDIHRLFEALHIPENIETYNKSKFDGIEAFCVFLKRFSYPCKYSDLIQLFGLSVPEMSMISKRIVDHISSNFDHLLLNFDQPWQRPEALEQYCDAVHQKGAPLVNCFGFVDGTVRPVCKPGVNQRVLYNGHKRIHSIKFQSVVLPNGLIGNLQGPYEGKKHDSSMLAASGLLNQLQQFAHKPNMDPVCLYGDPAYPLRVHLQAPFPQNAGITEQQKLFNKNTSKVRICVEWLFKEITTYFAFMDFKKNLKIGLSAVGKMYRVCALLTNARSCLYENQTQSYFNVDPPYLEEYFV